MCLDIGGGASVGRRHRDVHAHVVVAAGAQSPTTLLPPAHRVHCLWRPPLVSGVFVFQPPPFLTHSQQMQIGDQAIAFYNQYMPGTKKNLELKSRPPPPPPLLI